MALRTLTVQDVLWINLQITRRVNHYSNPRLEEATYYQFGYGDSNGIEAQAARLLSGFVRMKPFDAGNEATALATALAFLELNERRLDLDDAALAERVRSAVGSSAGARELICDHLVHSHAHGEGPAVRAVITDVLQRYSRTISALEPATV